MNELACKKNYSNNGEGTQNLRPSKMSCEDIEMRSF